MFDDVADLRPMRCEFQLVGRHRRQANSFEPPQALSSLPALQGTWQPKNSKSTSATNSGLRPERRRWSRRLGVGSRTLASRAASSGRPRPRLDSRTFLRGALEQALAAGGDGLPPFRSVTYSFMAQAWSGNRLLHYELWLRSRLRVLEIGLHFEADPLTNARLLAAFRAHERSIRRALGSEARVEPWDKGWARVWEPLQLEPLDEDFQRRVSGRLGRYVKALEPILQMELPAGVAWSRPRGNAGVRTRMLRANLTAAADPPGKGDSS
jgi:hypothetical protein